MKRILSIFAILGILVASLSAGEVNPFLTNAGLGIEGNVNIGNDVMWRGVSVTDRGPGIQGNARLVAITKYGKFYGDVDAKSTVANPLMTYSAGYENAIGIKTPHCANAKVYGKIEYKVYQFQAKNHGLDIDNLDFNTIYVKAGLQNVAMGALNVYGVAEFVDKKNDTRDFNTENRYGVEADYTFNTLLGDVVVGGQYFNQNKWGEDCGVYISNTIYESTDLKVGYNHFSPDKDTQSYEKDTTNTYLVSLNYRF